MQINAGHTASAKKWRPNKRGATSVQLAHLSDTRLVNGRRYHEVTAVGRAEPEALVHAAVRPLGRLHANGGGRRKLRGGG